MNIEIFLVVDNDITIRKYVRANLETRDYQVLTAGDGLEALAIIEKESLDLVLLDIVMPKTKSFEVCRQVRQWSQVPNFMLSSRNEE
jgi:two-component system, OmpR family, response regulator VicR